MDKLRITRYLDILMEACFYALLVAVTFSTSLVEIFSSILIAAWVIKRLVTRDITDLKNVPFLLIALYWAWTVLSCVNSAYFKESMRGVLKAAEYSLLFITAATSFNDEKVAKRALYALLFASILVSADGFFQYITGHDFIRHRNLINLDYLHRVSASFVHPNDFGVYLLVVALVFSAVIFSRNQRLREKMVLAVPLSMVLASLYLTKSRGGL
jgi:ABC-type amino acid transport system permease subunit